MYQHVAVIFPSEFHQKHLQFPNRTYDYTGRKLSFAALTTILLRYSYVVRRLLNVLRPRDLDEIIWAVESNVPFDYAGLCAFQLNSILANHP